MGISVAGRQADSRAAVRGATVRAVNSVRSFVAILKFMNFSAPRWLWLWLWLCGLWSAGAAAAAAAACQTEFPTQRVLLPVYIQFMLQKAGAATPHAGQALFLPFFICAFKA